MEQVTKKYQYYAFISYKREDEKWAKWLQHKLEYYKVPLVLRKADPQLPENLRPVFKDTTDLSAGYLENTLNKALLDSRFLIVICSPKAAHSPWVDKEVQAFVDDGRDANIIPFIIDGHPYSNNNEECFPPALKSLSGPKELLGININEYGQDAAVIKVIAHMINVGFDSLWQRYRRTAAKRRRIMGGAILLFIGALIGIVTYIWHKNVELNKKNEIIFSQNIKIKEEYDRANSERDRANMSADSIRLQKNLLQQSYKEVKEANSQLAIEKDRVIAENWAMQEQKARFIAAQAQRMIANGQLLTAERLLFDVIPRDLENPERPYVIECEAALRQITANRYSPTKYHVINAFPIDYSAFAVFSTDGERFICRYGVEQYTYKEYNLLGQEVGKYNSKELENLKGYNHQEIINMLTETTYYERINKLGIRVDFSNHDSKDTLIINNKNQSIRVNLWKNEGFKLRFLYVSQNYVMVTEHPEFGTSAKTMIYDLFSGKPVTDTLFTPGRIYGFAVNDDELVLETGTYGSNSITISNWKEKKDITRIEKEPIYYEVSGRVSLKDRNYLILMSQMDNNALLIEENFYSIPNKEIYSLDGELVFTWDLVNINNPTDASCVYSVRGKETNIQKCRGRFPLYTTLEPELINREVVYARGDSTLYIWDINQCAIDTLRTSGYYHKSNYIPTPSNKYIVFSYEDSIFNNYFEIYDIRKKKIINIQNVGRFKHYAICPDVTDDYFWAYEDGRLQMYSVPELKVKKNIPTIDLILPDIILSKDGITMAIIGKGIIVFYNTISGLPSYNPIHHDQEHIVHGKSNFSPDSRYFIFHTDHYNKIFDLSTSTTVISFDYKYLPLFFNNKGNGIYVKKNNNMYLMPFEPIKNVLQNLSNKYQNTFLTEEEKRRYNLM